MSIAPVLIAGAWRQRNVARTFRASNPATGQTLADEFPISGWEDCQEMLGVADQIARQLRDLPRATIADALEAIAAALEARKAELVDAAHLETALPKTPRLADVELPRTINQLRQAAVAARTASWALPTVDTKLNIRSCLAPVGPVVVFGPNNFPFAFNAVSGGDFAAALAAGNPVIAKGHPSHPRTTRLLAEAVHDGIVRAGLPAGTLQMIYHLEPADGLRLVGDARVGAVAFTGSRRAGMALKAAAEASGNPIYLEMSSLNPVVILPGALAERPEKIADELADNALVGTGQFCTKPGLVFLIAGEATERLVEAVRQRFTSRPAGALFASNVLEGLEQNVRRVAGAGATLLCGGERVASPGYRLANTLLRMSGNQFVAAPEAAQVEMFGNAILLVVCRDQEQLLAALRQLEGNLTGCVYSATAGADETLYGAVASELRPRVGRLLNDKMPPGVALSPAMNHGGPYPSTGHAGYTSVGIPASIRRFAALQCFDNVRDERLPELLRNKNPGGVWRNVDGAWTTGDVGA